MAIPLEKACIDLIELALFIILRLIWNQTEFRLVPDRSEGSKFQPDFSLVRWREKTENT